MNFVPWLGRPVSESGHTLYSQACAPATRVHRWPDIGVVTYSKTMITFWVVPVQVSCCGTWENFRAQCMGERWPVQVGSWRLKVF